MDWKKNKIEYRTYCQKEQNLPLFLQEWWLDLVCQPEGWQVCISRDNGGNIQGVLPFRLTTYYGFKVIRMPDLTPRMGVHFNYPQNLKGETRLKRFERKTLTDLIKKLPRTAYYTQQFSINLNDWLPFKWSGFEETTRYTYLISKVTKLAEVWQKMDASVRNKIRKAEANSLEIVSSKDIDLFYRINQQSFDRQKMKMPYSLEFIKKLDQALKEHQQREILFAKDKNGKIHAGIYLVWDNLTMYNLMLGADSELRTNGAVQLLLWNGIQKAIESGKDFDFEGGMIESIEPIFRGFGAALRPYHKISKSGNRLFRILTSLR